jgi:putative FmdB family regulatory protein
MPIYEYRCTKCGRTQEAIQKVDDKPLTKCTECSGRLEKLISRTAFHLKGGGWFSEGYGKESSSTPTKKDSPSSADSAGASGDKKDGSGGGKKAAAGGCGSGACGCH